MSNNNDLKSVYYQQNKKQGTLSYDGESLTPMAYSEEEDKKCVVYEYNTYDEPFSERMIIFRIPVSLLKK